MYKIININDVGSKIKTLRSEKGWTQETLSEKMHYSRQTVGKWERGILSSLTLDNVIDLCNLFDCDIGYLLGEYDTKRHVAADIHKETGLEESAIEALKNNYSMMKTDGKTLHLDILNELISRKAFFTVLGQASRYIKSIVRGNQIAQRLDELQNSGTVTKRYELTEELNRERIYAQPLELWQMQNDFVTTIKDIAKELVEKEQIKYGNDSKN